MRLPSLAIRLSLIATLLLTAGSPAWAQAPNTLSPEEIAEGWVLLFDGTALFGWRPSSKADWQVVDGTLTASQGEPGLLYTSSQWGNYVLKADFRSQPGTNSGIFLRTSPNPGPKEIITKCYEVNIAEATKNAFPTGSLVGRQKAEGVPDSNDWQQAEITANGPHFTVKLNGQTVCDYTDPKPLGRGYIGLQFRTGKVEFRNLKLLPLNMTSLFNGRDLSGWKSYPEMASVFTVTPEGWLNVKNGRGQLETEGQYGDFTLQLDAIVNGKELNSGVFYRCIPGESMNGYECQIHNGYQDGERTKPADCGTGGIFRRQNARKVVANDQEWFTMTLQADSNHVSVWVNGYPVTDWSDRRPPAANPRKGLRREPGTIQLQGHDATTDLSFRQLRVAELPAR